MGEETPEAHPADVGEGAVTRRGLTRRAVLRDGSAVTLAVLASGPLSALGELAVAMPARGNAYLDDAEMETLRGLVDRFIPGRPEDSADGALAGGCAEAIDALLGAFRTDPPKVYAGAPFSDRAGSRVNHFEQFLPLDSYEAKAWRLRIVGSKGRKELEFNGPVKGWQAIYREGLAALDEAAGGGFGRLPGAVRDVVLRTADDAAIAALLDIAWPHTYEFMYGAPEYGGNLNLVGWEYTVYAGDVQPRGWTRAQIEQRDGSSGERPVPAPDRRMMALAALASPEVVHGIVARSGGTLSGLRAELAPVLDFIDRAEGGSADGT